MAKLDRYRKIGWQETGWWNDQVTKQLHYYGAKGFKSLRDFLQKSFSTADSASILSSVFKICHALSLAPEETSTFFASENLDAFRASASWLSYRTCKHLQRKIINKNGFQNSDVNHPDHLISIHHFNYIFVSSWGRSNNFSQTIGKVNY